MSVSGDNLEEVFKKVPQRLWPKEYGGDAGTVDEITDYWVKKVQEYAEYFKDDDKYGVDEQIRPGKSTSSDLGVEGSFRKLDLD